MYTFYISASIYFFIYLLLTEQPCNGYFFEPFTGHEIIPLCLKFTVRTAYFIRDVTQVCVLLCKYCDQ